MHLSIITAQQLLVTLSKLAISNTYSTIVSEYTQLLIKNLSSDALNTEASVSSSIIGIASASQRVYQDIHSHLLPLILEASKQPSLSEKHSKLILLALKSSVASRTLVSKNETLNLGIISLEKDNK